MRRMGARVRRKVRRGMRGGDDGGVDVYLFGGVIDLGVYMGAWLCDMEFWNGTLDV